MEVGRVSIRVVPNTEHFRRQLQAQLKKAVKGVHVRIPVYADVKDGTQRQLSRSLDRITENVGRRNKGINVDVTPDMDLFQRKIMRDIDKIHRDAELGIPLTVDGERLRRQMRQAVKQARDEVRKHIGDDDFDATRTRQRLLSMMQNFRERVKNMTVTIDLDADPDRFQRRMMNEIERIRQDADAKIPLTVDGERFRRDLDDRITNLQRDIRMRVPVDVHMASDRRARLMREMETLRQDIDRVVNPPKKDSWGDRSRKTFDNLGARIKSTTSAISNFISSGGHAQRRILGLTRVGWLVLGVFTLIAPAISLVATLLASLPALIAAFGAAAGVLVLGWDGIKEAYENTLEPAVDGMKEALSARFKDQLTPIFQQWRDIIPLLTPRLQDVATGLSKLFGGVTDVLTSHQGIGMINGILTDTAKLFNDITPGVQAFVGGLLMLARDGAGAFDYLANTVNTFFTDFAAWTHRVTQSGALDAALKSMSQSFDAFFRLLNRTFEVGINNMPRMTEGLTMLFDGFGDLLVGLFPILAEFSNAIGKLLGQLGTTLGAVFTALQPSLTQLLSTLGDGLVTTLQILEPVLVAVGTALNESLLAVMNALAPVMPVVVSALETMGMVLAGAIQESAPLIAEAMGQLATAFADMFVALSPLIPELVTLATEVITQIAGKLPEMMPVLLGFIDSLPGMADAMVEALPSVISFTESFLEMLPAILDVTSSILKGFLGAVRAIAGVVSAVAPVVTTVFSGMFYLIEGIFAVGIGLMTGNWSTAGVMLLDITVEMFNNVITKVVEKIDEMIAEIAELPGKILQELTGLDTLLTPSGKALIQGFIDGIISMTFPALNAARGIVNAIRNLFPFSPAKEGPFSGRGYTTHSGRALVADFARGMLDNAQLAAEAAASMIGGVKAEIDKGIEGLQQGFDGWLGRTVADIRNGVDELGDKAGVENLAGKWEDALLSSAKVIDGKLGDAFPSLEQGLQHALDQAAKVDAKPVGDALAKKVEDTCHETTKIAEHCAEKGGEIVADGLGKSISKDLPKGVSLYQGFEVTDKDRAKEIRKQVRADLREQLKAEAKASGLRGEAMSEEVERKLEEQLPSALESAFREAGILAGQEAGVATGKAMGEGIEKGLEEELSKSTVIPDALKDQLEQIEDASGVEGFADKWEEALSATSKVFDHYTDEIVKKWDKAMEESGLAEFPQKFVEANANQLMSDLGISGSGAVPTLIKEIQKGSFTPDHMKEEHTHYHVEDVTDAQRMENNRRGREMVGRTRR